MILPPYLTKVHARTDVPRIDAFPLNLPIFANDRFSVDFQSPVTIIVGENGSGKSTILEAIAAHCGFSLAGGNANHVTGRSEASEVLKSHLRFAWKTKPAGGFFLRAETLQEFGAYLDDMAKHHGEHVAYNGYGDKSLRDQSHGEGFIGILENRLDSRGLVLLDEPEAALSPARQIQLLALLRRAEAAKKTQIIIATHSPIIMSYPWAELLEIRDGDITHTHFKDTNHFRLYRRFLTDPEGYHKLIFEDD